MAAPAAFLPVRSVGIDVDAHLLALAAERGRVHGVYAELHCADAGALPLESNAFDLVLDFGTCSHIADPTGALREIGGAAGGALEEPAQEVNR